MVTAVALLAGAPGRLRAQSGAFRTTDEGLHVGRFVLHPSLTLDYVKDSNVFFRSDQLPAAGGTESGLLLLRPRIVADLPFSQNRLRLAYAPVYRNYTTENLPLSRHVSHYFDIEAALLFGSAWHLTARDHWIRGVVELQEIDRGGELTFGLVPFTSHEPSLEVGVDLGARQGLAILPSQSRTQFDESEGAAFLSSERWVIEGRYTYRLNPSDLLYAFYARDRFDQERVDSFFGDQALAGRSAGVGLIRSLNREVAAQMAAGYKRVEVKGPGGRNFSGPVLDANATWQLSDGAGLVVTASRQPYQSYFLNNSYYVNAEVGLRFRQQPGQNLYWEVGGRLASKAYADKIDISAGPETPATEDCDGDGVPDGSDCDGNGLIDAFETTFCIGSANCPSLGVRRRDRVARLEIGAGYRIRRTLRVFVGYNTDRRASNIEQVVSAGFYDPFDYHIQRVFIRIEAGWL